MSYIQSAISFTWSRGTAIFCPFSAFKGVVRLSKLPLGSGAIVSPVSIMFFATVASVAFFFISRNNFLEFPPFMMAMGVLSTQMWSSIVEALTCCLLLLLSRLAPARRYTSAQGRPPERHVSG